MRRKDEMRWSAVWAWVVALCLHLGAWLWLWCPASPWPRAMVRAAAADGSRLKVRLVKRQPPVAVSLPRPLSAGMAKGRRSVPAAQSHVPPALPSVSVTDVSAHALPRLYGSDGTVVLRGLPGAALRAADQADMRHFQQAPCHRTRFAADWSRGQDESLGNQVARRYLSVVGLYNKASEANYQARRAWHDEACP